VLFGDVWVCSGQSNMEFAVAQVFNSSQEEAAAANYPNIRLFTVGTATTSDTQLPEFNTTAQQWAVAAPKTIPGFSAVCWFFARNLYDRYKVPQGLISSNWGGTPVEAWSSPDALAKCKTRIPRAISGPNPNTPSVLWNAMIVPLLPMTIRGATWYQGEANSGQGQFYSCAFPAMISDWRLKWGGTTSKEFGFFFVQLAPWVNSADGSEPTIRISQLAATKLPKVGYACAYDLGDPQSPYGSVHPRDKQDVGYRLHLSAVALEYGDKVQYLGPVATDYKVTTDAPNAEVTVNFSPESIGTGLVIRPGICNANLTANQCAWFEIGSSSGKWVNTTIALGGTSLTLKATVDTKVTGVRGGWSNYPIGALFNLQNLPYVPFAFPSPIH